MKEQDFTFMARDGANTLISLTLDGELVCGDQHINDLPPEDLRQIIKKLVHLILQMRATDALTGLYNQRNTK